MPPKRGSRGGGRGRGGARGGGRGRGGARGGSRGGRGGNQTLTSHRDVEEKREIEEVQPQEKWVEEVVTFQKLSPAELKDIKIQLLNTISSNMIKEPRYNDVSSATFSIKKLAKLISFYDPEFVFKIALYARYLKQESN